QKELTVLLEQMEQNIQMAYQQLNQWMQSDSPVPIEDQTLTQLPMMEIDTASHPGLELYQEALNLSRRTTSLEKQKLLPDLNLEVFRGTNRFPNAKVYHGIQAGVAIPLWFGAQSSKIKASKIHSQVI